MVKGSRDSTIERSCKIRGGRDSSQALYHLIWEGHSKNLGNQNARTDISYITLGRGVATSTCFRKRGNSRKTREGDVGYVSRMKGPTLR